MSVAAVLDLIYELKVEYKWEATFAAAAKTEYLRWLQIRASARDFESCKLPPSRVVYMVWNLHRQWTLDYCNTCATMGGFIHHYPPAMRLSVAREQAYSNTLRLYHTHFNEEPPARYWGPSICAEPLRDPRDVKSDEPKKDGRQSPTSKFSRSKTRTRGQSGEQTLTAFDVNVSTTLNPFGGPVLNGLSASPGGTPATPNRRRSLQKSPKKITRSPRVPEGHVLRPLAPGEKRRRGRPSLSEYVPADDAAVLQASAAGAQNARNVRARRSKGGANEAEPSLEKQPTEANAPKDDSGPQASPNTVPAPLPEVVGATAVAPPQTGTSASGQALMDANGTVLLKRPRGRPRKDGTWPRPRTPATQAAQAASVAVAAKVVHAAKAVPKQVAANKQERPAVPSAVPIAPGRVSLRDRPAGKEVATVVMPPQTAPTTGLVQQPQSTTAAPPPQPPVQLMPPIQPIQPIHPIQPLQPMQPLPAAVKQSEMTIEPQPPQMIEPQSQAQVQPQAPISQKPVDPQPLTSQAIVPPPPSQPSPTHGSEAVKIAPSNAPIPDAPPPTVT